MRPATEQRIPVAFLSEEITSRCCVWQGARRRTRSTLKPFFFILPVAFFQGHFKDAFQKHFLFCRKLDKFKNGTLIGFFGWNLFISQF